MSERHTEGMFTIGLIASTNDYIAATHGAVVNGLSMREFLLVNALDNIAEMRPSRPREAFVSTATSAIVLWRKQMAEIDRKAQYKREVARAQARRRQR